MEIIETSPKIKVYSKNHVRIVVNREENKPKFYLVKNNITHFISVDLFLYIYNKVKHFNKTKDFIDNECNVVNITLEDADLIKEVLKTEFSSDDVVDDNK